MDHLGLVETVDRFGEGIVVRVTHAADGGLDARVIIGSRFSAPTPDRECDETPSLK
jgi:hypothetical protein